MEYITKFQETSTQALGDGALAYTYTFLKDGYLDRVESHFSGACSQTQTITRDNIAGANYDTVLDTQAIGGATDYVYAHTRKVFFRKGDILKIDITTGGSTTAYLTIFLEEERTWQK